MGKLNDTDLELKLKIAIRIKQLRESTGKNSSEFAKETFSDRQTQHRLEKGRGATIYTINKLCLDLGISLKEFFEGEIFDKK